MWCPGGSSVTLNKGDVFIFSILLGQSPRSNFPVGSSSGSQRAIEIDEILAFQCFKEWGFHQFWSQGWRVSAESQSWKTQGCTQRAGLWQFVLKGSEGPKITGTPGKSTPRGEHCRFCSSRIHFLLTLQGANLICLRMQNKCIFCVASFSQKAVDETFQYLTKNFLSEVILMYLLQRTSLLPPQKPLTFSYPMWWSMSGANLPELRDTQRTGKTRFLGVPARVFLEKISIWIGELKITLTHVGGHLTNLRVWTEWKEGGRTNHLCLSWVDLSTFSCPQTSVLLTLRCSDLEWITSPAFSGLQLAEVSWVF